MQFDIITIFPKTLEAIFSESIIARAIEKDAIQVNIHDLRNWTEDKRQTVDDKPFGGGPGMLLMVEPIYQALKDLKVYPKKEEGTKVVLTSARGDEWKQPVAQTYADEIDRLVIICGHYEGVDHRVVEHLIDAEISIGDYVLTGGELPAAVIVDSISRLLPGVVGNQDSLREESHTEEGSKEYPQYTRPASFETQEGEVWQVPEVLLSGDHANISQWREENKSSS